jgi:hypothetical protein
VSASAATLSHWERIAGTLAYIDGTFPIEMVFDARVRWPEVREGFLSELVQAVSDPDGAIEDENALPIYAMFLAAEKRDAAFAPTMLDLLRLPPVLIDDLVGETAVTEGMGRCLASIWQGDDEPIRTLATDDSLDIFVRLAAVEAIVVRAIEGDADLDSVTEFVFSLIQQSVPLPPFTPAKVRGKPHRKNYNPFFSMLLSTLAELGARQYWPQIEQWDREGLIDPMYENLAGLQETMFSPSDARLAHMFKPPLHSRRRRGNVGLGMFQRTGTGGYVRPRATQSGPQRSVPVR